MENFCLIFVDFFDSKISGKEVLFMNQDALATELSAIRRRAEETTRNIEQISQKRYAEGQLLRQLVREYGEKRVQLLKQKLQECELTWCTCCSKVIPESEVKFLLFEGKEEYSHGYGNMFYGFRSFSKFHRACSACQEHAADRHGRTGRYDSQAKDQESFYAFRVEKRDDGYHARKFGDWAKLDDEKCKVDEPRNDLVEKLEEEFNLPPRIDFRSHWPSDDELVIHERKLAKAS